MLGDAIGDLPPLTVGVVLSPVPIVAVCLVLAAKLVGNGVGRLTD